MYKQQTYSNEAHQTLEAELARQQADLQQVIGELAIRENTLRAEAVALGEQASLLEMRRIETVAEANRIASEVGAHHQRALAGRSCSVLSRLRRQHRAIASAAESAEIGEALSVRKQSLLEQDPALGANYAAFLAGERLVKDIQSLPSYMLEAHRHLAEKVAPVLELDRQLVNPRQNSITLPLDLLYYAQDCYLDVVLPINALDLEYSDSLIAINARMIEALVSALMEMLHEIDTVPVDFHETTWAGFQTLHIEFDAEIEPLNVCRHYTGHLVQTLEKMDDLPFAVRLDTTLLDESLWAYTLEDDSAYAPTDAPSMRTAPLESTATYEAYAEQDNTQVTTEAMPAEPAKFETSPRRTIAVSSHSGEEQASSNEEMLLETEENKEEPVGLLNRVFAKKDIVSWNRPLRSVADSKWNQRARRIRTLLLRMAGEGNIGIGEGVLQAHVLENLPDRDRNDLSQAIELMLAVGFLSSHQDAPDLTFTITPSRLEEIAGLINRDISDGWTAVLQ